MPVFRDKYTKKIPLRDSLGKMLGTFTLRELEISQRRGYDVELGKLQKKAEIPIELNRKARQEFLQTLSQKKRQEYLDGVEQLTIELLLEALVSWDGPEEVNSENVGLLPTITKVKLFQEAMEMSTGEREVQDFLERSSTVPNQPEPPLEDASKPIQRPPLS